MVRWFGIDFSGDWRKWRTGCGCSNVWIAEIRSARPGELTLSDLRRPQQLPGTEVPFMRLANLLAAGDYIAAAIDAPFSIPAGFLPLGGYAAVLHAMNSVALTPDRPFPSAAAFVAAFLPPDSRRGLKKYRSTELACTGVNVRSTLWAGPRGGAAMTAACLKLLASSRPPIWPWAPSSESGLVVEAFPAAQLKHWRLPHQQYNGAKPEAVSNRGKIVAALRTRVDIPEPFQRQLADCADALDAVVCAMAAIAVSENRLAHVPGPTAANEGWIAIHQ